MIPQVTVTGTYEDAEGNPATGTVTFKLNGVLVDPVDDIRVPRTPIVATLDGTGSFSQVLNATSGGDITPDGLLYTVTEQITGSRTTRKKVALPSTPANVDVADLLPVDDTGVVWTMPSFMSIVSAADLDADPHAAISAAIAELEAGEGGTVVLPLGRWEIDDTILIEGAPSLDSWSGRSGIEIVGAGMRGSVLEGPAGKALFQFGDASNKVVISLRHLSLVGPGKTNSGSIGIDSRTTGGSYRFDNVLIDQFEIGVRYHDNTLVTADELNIRNCTKGLALGYYSDVHSYVGCRFDDCDIGAHVGYVDPARDATLVPTESHCITFLSCIANRCGVGLYVQGSAGVGITWLNGYMEAYTDVGIRVADAAFARSVSAPVLIEQSYFNGNDTAAYAIEVNRALVLVRVEGIGTRNHTTCAVNIRHSSAKVLVEMGQFNTTSGEAGDVKLPDGSYLTVGSGRPIRYGQLSEPVAFAATLPTASVAWLGAQLVVSGTIYQCGSNGSGGYAWYAIEPRFHPTS